MTVSIIRLPFTFIEEKRYRSSVEKTPIVKPPLFILGHWRSGTTLMYRLFAKDPSFQFLPMERALFPGTYWVGGKAFRVLLGLVVPKRRPTDNLPFGLELPAEIDFSIAALSSVGFYSGMLHFPRHFKKYNRYLDLEKLSEKKQNLFLKTMLYIMKKEVKFQNAQQLVIKSPPNTARVKLLLSLFPNAKFVHIFRNPYSVFCSTMKLMRLSLPLTTLQALPSEAMLEDIIIERYKIIYRAYLRDRALIPAENLVEVRFEDFIKDPMAGMENIYTKLGINSFSDAKESFKEYFEEQKSHRVDSYEMSETVKEKLEKELDFAFKAFRYDTKE